MRRTPHTGYVFLDVPGTGEVRLRFTWAGIAELHGLYGKEWEKEVERIASDLDANGLAQILAIASEHGRDWWLEQSPPFIPAVLAVQEALRVAFFGPGDGADDRPTMARRLTTLLRHLSPLGSSSAGSRASSGA